MGSAFFDKKMTKLFQFWDYNGSGQLDQSDYEDIAARIATERGWASGSVQAAKVLNAMMGNWGQVRQFADDDSDHTVTLSEWLHYGEHIRTDMTAYRISVVDMMGALLSAVDQDDDGRVSLEDYKMWFRIFGEPEASAESAFTRMDADGNGQLEITELIGAVDDFFQGDDESAPGNYMFGELD
jgi:Ca2+-binding EF-hand superfamily protein